MLSIPRLYVGGTTGARDGTAVRSTDELGAILNGTTAAVSAIGSALTLHLRCAQTERTTDSVVISIASSIGGSSDSAFTVSSNGSSYASTANIGIVGDVNVPLYVMQNTGKADDARGVYVKAVFGADIISLPLISGGPSISGVTSAGCTVTVSFNSVTTSAKWIVKTNNSTPSTSDWNSATAFATAPSSTVNVTGLSNATLYYAFVRGYDAGGFVVDSSALSFTTGTASNLAPSFSAQPTEKAGSTTRTAFVVTYGATDADGDTIVHEISTDNGSTYTSASPTYNSGTGKYEITVTGKSAATAYTCKVRIGDSGHSGTNGTVSSAVTITTASNSAPAYFTPTVVAGSTEATVTFSTTDADGDALTYKVAVTTSATAPSDWSVYSAQTSPYTATGLTNGTTYYAHVQATEAFASATTVGTSASFVPSAMLSRTTAGYVDDDFNRADGPLGALWTQDVGSTAVVSGNQFAASNSEENRVHRGTFSAADVLVQGAYVGNAIQLIARSAGGTGNHYVLTYSVAGGYTWYKSVGGSYTNIGANWTTNRPTAGGTVAITVTGTGSTVTLTTFLNGTQINSQNDTSGTRITASGYAGIRHDTGTGPSVDNFLACSKANITITGVPAGYSANISDGTNTVTANVSGSTITLTPSAAMLLKATGWTLTIYDGAGATGTLKFTQTGVYGGDTWTIS